MTRIVPASQTVAWRDVAAQELVERDVELRRQVEQRLEREATPTPLGLGDGARRNVRKACEVCLAQMPRHPEAAEGGPEPCRRRGCLEHREAGREPVAKHAPLDPRRPPLRLRDPQPSVTDIEHALRDPLYLTAQRRRVPRRGERPVGDGSKPEEERATAREEAPRRLAAPALTHGLDRVEQQELPRSAGAALRDCVEERPWLGQRAVLTRVDEIDARVRLCELRGLPYERDKSR